MPIVVDGGTSGTATIDLAHQWIEASAPRTRILAFMDPCSLYLATHDFICHRLEIANDIRNLDLDAAAAALETHADYVIGFKVRACHTGDPSVSPFLEGAKSVAGDLPIMVHLGRFPFTPTISTPPPCSRPCAAATSSPTPSGAHRASSTPTTGQAVPEFRDAIDRGVRLDVGHSATDFRFRDAQRLFDLGYVPDSISTDLNVFNIDHPVRSLPETMSKVWALGVELSDVVAMATTGPAASIHRSHQFGTLDVGRDAEVSVLRIEEGPAELSDGYEVVQADRRLVPVGCVRGGTWIEATAGLSRARPRPERPTPMQPDRRSSQPIGGVGVVDVGQSQSGHAPVVGQPAGLLQLERAQHPVTHPLDGLGRGAVALDDLAPHAHVEVLVRDDALEGLLHVLGQPGLELHEGLAGAQLSGQVVGRHPLEGVDAGGVPAVDPLLPLGLGGPAVE